MAKNPAIILYDADGNPVSVIADGGVYRLAQFAKVQNSSGSAINPATQETLAAIKDTDGVKKIVDALPTGSNTIGKVDQGTAGASAWKTDGSGVTQPVSATSLPLPAGAATETTLAAIKNTDGVKKIVDALPTGDNTVGRVKITDGTNVADILVDGGVKRLRVDAVVSAGVGTQVEGRAADGAPPVGYPVLIGGQDGANVQTILTDTLGRIVTVNAGTPVTNLVTDYLKDGTNYQMKVNGATVPKIYTYLADGTKDITLLELRFVYSAQAFAWSGNGFGKDAAGKLTNGILIELIVNGGVTVTLATVQVNEDFLRTFGDVPVINTSVLGDVMTPAWKFTGGSSLVLKAGTADRVRVTIRDNLTTGSLGVNYLTATFFGTKAP